MTISANYLGMEISIPADEPYNRQYFRFCREHRYSLQHCPSCSLVHYPPSPACPWCGGAELAWREIPTAGTVHSFTRVAHAIQPAFKAHVPYYVLLVELDYQKGKPSEFEGLRILGNLTDAEGMILSGPQDVQIGDRVRMVWSDLSDDISLPQWTFERG